MNERANTLLRWADERIGSPLLAMVGALARSNQSPRRPPASYRRLVFLKTGALGDALLTSVAVSSIKSQFPGCWVVYICTASNIEAVRGIPEVDQIYLFNLQRPAAAFWGLRSLGRFDLLLDFAPWARLNALIAFFLPARIKIGFRTPEMHRHYEYDVAVDHNSRKHELDNYRELLRAAGIRPGAGSPVFHIDRTDIDSATGFTGTTSGIVFHPFPGGAQRCLKMWPQQSWRELGKRLIREGYEVVITGGHGDKDEAKALATEIGPGCRSVAGVMTLNLTAHLIEQAGLLVSVDTGIMHLAAAVGAAVISLHGPTAPERWGAIGDKVYPVRTRHACTPCISLGFDSKCKTGGCMASITVDGVFTTVMTAITVHKAGGGDHAVA